VARKKQKTSAGQRPTAEVPESAAVEPMDAWDRIAWVCLHLLVILVPIAMSNFGPLSGNGLPITFDQFDIVKVFVQRGLVLVALGAWLIGLLVRGGRIRFTRGEWVILAFLGWIVLTTVLSVHPETAVFGKYRRFEGLLSFFTYAATFFVALQLADRATRVRSLARSLAIGGFLVAWYGAIQVVGSVSLGVARVMQPAVIVLTVVVPIGLAYLALSRADDAETKRAYWIGAVIALAGGYVFASGLSANIDMAVYRGVELVSIDPVIWGTLPFEPNRAFSTFGNPDLLGGYLIFPWAITLALALSEKHRLWRSLYWLSALLLAFVGITTYVRGAWIGAVVSLGVLVFAYMRARSGTEMRLTRTDRTYITGAAIAGAAVMVASSLRPDPVRNVLTRVISIFQFDQGSALTRSQIWEAAAAAVAERPLTGWGADTFRLLFPMFKPAEYVQTAGYLSVADNVHNYPLQLASGIGIPGAVLLYGLIAVALILAARHALAKGTGRSNLLLAGFWAAVLGYVFYLLFGLSVTGSTIMMWVSMGVLLGPSCNSREIAVVPWRTAGAVAVLGLVLLASVLNVRYIVADTHYIRGRQLTQGIERVKAIERAIELNPYNDMYRIELGSAWTDMFGDTVDQYVQARRDGTLTTDLQDDTVSRYERAVGAFEDAIAFVPLEYDTYVFLANLHNQAAVYLDPAYASDGEDTARRAVAVEEYGPAARLQLARALMLQGKTAEAAGELEFALSLDSNYMGASLMLADAYRQLGQLDDSLAIVMQQVGWFPMYSGQVGLSQDQANNRRALDANYLQVSVPLAEAFQAQGRTIEARTLLEEMRLRFPADATVLGAIAAIDASPTPIPNPGQ